MAQESHDLDRNSECTHLPALCEPAAQPEVSVICMCNDRSVVLIWSRLKDGVVKASIILYNIHTTCVIFASHSHLMMHVQ